MCAAVDGGDDAGFGGEHTEDLDRVGRSCLCGANWLECIYCGYEECESGTTEWDYVVSGLNYVSYADVDYTVICPDC